MAGKTADGRAYYRGVIDHSKYVFYTGACRTRFNDWAIHDHAPNTTALQASLGNEHRDCSTKALVAWVSPRSTSAPMNIDRPGNYYKRHPRRVYEMCGSFVASAVEVRAQNPAVMLTPSPNPSYSAPSKIQATELREAAGKMLNTSLCSDLIDEWTVISEHARNLTTLVETVEI
jgi:hypothetical protein